MIPLPISSAAAAEATPAPPAGQDMPEDASTFGLMFDSDDAAGVIPESEIDIAAPLLTDAADPEQSDVELADEASQPDIETPDFIAIIPASLRSSAELPVLAQPTPAARPEGLPAAAVQLPTVASNKVPERMHLSENPRPTRSSVAQSVLEGQLPNGMIAGRQSEKGAVGRGEGERSFGPQNLSRAIMTDPENPKPLVSTAPAQMQLKEGQQQGKQSARAEFPVPHDHLQISQHPRQPQVRAISPQVSLPNSAMVGLAELPTVDLPDTYSSRNGADQGLAAISGDRAINTGPATGVTLPPAGAEQARLVAGQLAQALVSTNGGATEILLNPEELGRVRLSMMAGDGVITLTIAAERQETTDLLRRHIDSLAQQFRELGYDSLTFSFGASQGDEPHQQDDAEDESHGAAAPDAPDLTAPARGPSVTAALDLRL